MSSTRRNFLHSAAGGLLLAGGGSLLCPLRLRADDDGSSSSVADALSMFVFVWNQFANNDSSNFGMNWTNDPDAASMVSNAFTVLSNAWATDGTDAQVQNALASGGPSMAQLQFEIPYQAYLELLAHGANVQLFDVLGWFGNATSNLQAAMDTLATDPLSGMVTSLGQALGDPVDFSGVITSMSPAVLVGAVMADTQFSNMESGSPTTAAGALAYQLANMALS